MPKDTFLKLNKTKRDRIIKAFLVEFTTNSFDEASISKVVKHLKIAKGSIYQYFDDKLDLYTFLITECTTEKKKYVNIDRKTFKDFWAYFKELYVVGYLFDVEHPLESHFLYKLTQNMNSPSIKLLYNNLIGQTIDSFVKMVEHEIQIGLFRNDIPPKIMGHTLYKTGVAIMEYLEHENIIAPKESINNELPVFHGKKELLLDTVDKHIKLIKESYDKK